MMRKVLRLTVAVAATASLALLAPLPTRGEAPLQAAYAEADITPPLGGSMPGYFADRKAAGVLDPLKAKVLFLRKGDERIALVSCDLIGMGAPLVGRIREAVARKVKPAPTHVWVHCTHTHTGGQVRDSGTFTSDAEEIYPALYPGKPDERWVGEMVERTADAVARASASLADEKALTLHEGREGTVAHYRRFVMADGTVRTNPGRNNPNVVRPAGEIDPRMHVLRFGSARILTVIYGLHPDCVGGNHYSADYPHHLAEALRESEGPQWRVIYFNAACGNINHVDVKDAAQRSGPEESRRIGRTLAAAASAALKNGTPVPTDVLAARSATVTCRLRRPSAAEVAEAEDRLKNDRDPMAFNGLFAPAVMVLAKTRDREHMAEIGALRLGSFGLAAGPGEYFVELAREIEAGSPLKPTRTIGLTNGSMGYIPHRQGYVEGGYEAGYRSARYEPGNGHRWAATAAALLREMSQ
jgi:hypothetical protein